MICLMWAMHSMIGGADKPYRLPLYKNIDAGYGKVGRAVDQLFVINDILNLSWVQSSKVKSENHLL